MLEAGIKVAKRTIDTYRSRNKGADPDSDKVSNFKLIGEDDNEGQN